MAYKRALVSATLTATAAGDIFTQDLEDMEPQTRDSILDAELIPSIQKPKPTSNASLQEIRDSVSLLGNKTFTKEEDGKTLLFVAGNAFLIKEVLGQMGFLYRKPQGAQYGETYMDITHLVEKSNPLGKAKVSKPKTYAELDQSVTKLGLALDDVTINGKAFAEVIGREIFENKANLKALGFKWSNDDSKSWRFDLSVFETKNQTKANLNEMRAKAEMFGFRLSDPVKNRKEESWIQAIPLDDNGDTASLMNNLGFSYFVGKEIYALKIC